MGMPRYLSEKFATARREMSALESNLYAICAGVEYGQLVVQVINKNSRAGRALALHHTLSCFIKGRWLDLEKRRYRTMGEDNMERVSARLYLGLLERGGGDCSAEFRAVLVPRYFAERLEKCNREREESDRQQAFLVRKITATRSKVYASRCFPLHLRAIIFERDEYRCRNCLRDRATLVSYGLHLEVDHIVAYVDGGKTTYSNGLTLCNECNIAKHHSKGYLNSLRSLNHPRADF